MLICRNAKGVHGQRKVGTPCSKTFGHTVVQDAALATVGFCLFVYFFIIFSFQKRGQEMGGASRQHDLLSRVRLCAHDCVGVLSPRRHPDLGHETDKMLAGHLVVLYQRAQSTGPNTRPESHMSLVPQSFFQIFFSKFISNNAMLFRNFQIINIWVTKFIHQCLKLLGQGVNKLLLKCREG